MLSASYFYASERGHCLKLLIYMIQLLRDRNKLFLLSLFHILMEILFLEAGEGRNTLGEGQRLKFCSISKTLS